MKTRIQIDYIQRKGKPVYVVRKFKLHSNRWREDRETREVTNTELTLGDLEALFEDVGLQHGNS